MKDTLPGPLLQAKLESLLSEAADMCPRDTEQQQTSPPVPERGTLSPVLDSVVANGNVLSIATSDLPKSSSFQQFVQEMEYPAPQASIEQPPASSVTK